VAVNVGIQLRFPGVPAPYLTEPERYAVNEYLKTLSPYTISPIPSMP
jgi:hypothetical protein